MQNIATTLEDAIAAFIAKGGQVKTQDNDLQPDDDMALGLSDAWLEAQYDSIAA